MNKKALLGIVILLLVIVGVVLIVNMKSSAGNGDLRIGVFQVVRHPVLDGMADRFQKELQKLFPRRKIEFVSLIPEGDSTKVELMAQKLASEDFDLAYVIGTNLAQSLAKKTSELPVILGAATDPEAAGLAETWEKPGKNITGTSDLSPLSAQLDYLGQIIPNAKKVGIIYNPSEDNSAIIVKMFKKECEKKKLTPVTATVADQNQVRQSVVSLTGKVDVLYAPTDATVQSAFPVVIKTADELGIPVFNCDEGTVKKGAIFSVGFDYFDLGRISAEMAADVINGKTKPGDMPIRQADTFSLFYNKKQIEKLKLNMPDNWVKEGKKVAE